MRIVFTWQPKEWQEVYLLATTKPRKRRASSPSMSYFVLVLMALGGVGDVVHALRTSRYTGMRGTLVPALFGIALLFGAVFVATRLWRTYQQVRRIPTRPAGEQQVVLQETGWNALSENEPNGPIHAWSELQGQRRGESVVALLTRDGRVIGFPVRAMGEDLNGSVHRLLTRKLAGMPPAA